MGDRQDKGSRNNWEQKQTCGCRDKEGPLADLKVLCSYIWEWHWGLGQETENYLIKTADLKHKTYVDIWELRHTHQAEQVWTHLSRTTVLQDTAVSAAGWFIAWKDLQWPLLDTAQAISLKRSVVSTFSSYVPFDGVIIFAKLGFQRLWITSWKSVRSRSVQPDHSDWIAVKGQQSD
jgi:hypothetical protein